MFDVNKLAKQYYLVKWPASFFHDTNGENRIDQAKINALFKNTGVYAKLGYNFEQAEPDSPMKEKFRNAYTDILNLAGSAIQVIILRDLDYIMTKAPISMQDQLVCEYMMNRKYIEGVQSLFGVPENIIDKVSFKIANSPLNEENLQYLENIKSYLTTFVRENQNKLRYFRELCYEDLRFLSYKGYSHELVKKGVNKIVESSANAYVRMLKIAEEKAQMQAQASFGQPEERRGGQQEIGSATLAKPNEAKKASQEPRVILSIDEAIAKNFEMFVGLDKVKEQLKAKYALIMKYPHKTDLNLNFRLVGNPGVGKSTMAEVMGRTFYDSGLLEKDTFNEYNGADLKAKFTGHTTAKVKEIIDESIGGTLLIDEAYSLNQEDGRSDAFTQDATSQIVKSVEQLLKSQAKNPDLRTCIILAGYADKIEALMKTNSGFKRRFPNLISLPDYTDKQLLDIFCFHMKKDGLTLSKTAKSELLKLFKAEREKKDFSNAGFAMNLLQLTEEQQAVRTLERLYDFLIKPEDIHKASEVLLDQEEERRPIGFGN